MALDHELKRHLHDLMVEIAEKTSAERVQYKNQLLGKARQTHNAAAIPIAYKDAELHSIETRIGKTIEKYIEAVSIWGCNIDATFEKDMISEFIMLTAGPKTLHFPPALRGHQVQAVQGAFARERAQVANRLVREGTNRLRELKMKAKQVNPNISQTTNNIFHGPVGKFYSNSVDQSTNAFIITLPNLQSIDRISEGHPELQAVAQEIRNSQLRGGGVFEKFQKWVVLLSSIDGLAEKVHQHYPEIAALIGHATIMIQSSIK